MRYLLDTNISIYLIKSRSERFLHRMRGCPTGGVGVSVLTLAERQLWRVQKPTAVEQNQVALEAFLLPLEIANLSRDSTWAYGEIRADFEKQGCPIVPLDTLIAAHALPLMFCRSRITRESSLMC